MAESSQVDFIEMQINAYFNDPQKLEILHKEQDVDQALYHLVKELSSEYSRNNDIKENSKAFDNVMKKYGKKIEKIAKEKGISEDFSYDEMRFSEKLEQAIGKVDPQEKKSALKSLIANTKDPKIITDKDITVAIKDGDSKIVDQLIETKLDNVKNSKSTKLSPNAHAKQDKAIRINDDDYKLAKKIQSIREVFKKNRLYNHNVKKIDTHLNTAKGNTIDIIIQEQEKQRSSLRAHGQDKSSLKSKKAQEEIELAKQKMEAKKIQEAKDRKRQEEIILLFEIIQEREFEDLVTKLKNERDELESKTGKIDAKIDNTIAELEHISENLGEKLEIHSSVHINAKDKKEIAKQNNEMQQLSNNVNDSENKLYEDLNTLKTILAKRIDIVESSNKTELKAKRVHDKEKISYSRKNQPKLGDWVQPSPSPDVIQQKDKGRSK